MSYFSSAPSNPADVIQSVPYSQVEAAAKRLAGQAHRTPVLTSTTVDRRVGNLQRAGAFKFRGAFNALSQLPQSNGNRAY
jgi:threonine dehydratase